MNNIVLNILIALVGIAIFTPDGDIIVNVFVGAASIAVVRFFIYVMRGV